MKEKEEEKEKGQKGSIMRVLIPSILATAYVGARKVIKARRELTPHRTRRVYADSQEKPLALVGLNIIDVAGGRVLWDRVVELSEGRIIKISSRKGWQPSPDAQTMELEGYFAIPGLINAHCHMTLAGALDLSLEFIASMARQVEKNFEECVPRGVTTVRDMGGPYLVLGHLKDRVEKGDLLGPRLYYAGAMIKTPGGYPDFFDVVLPDFLERRWGQGILKVSGPKEAREAVKKMIDIGASHIKIGLDDFSLRVGNKPIPILDDQTIEALVDEAKRGGVKVAAHLRFLEGFRRALKFEIESLEHMPCDGPLTDEDLSAFIKGDHTIVPTNTVAWAFAFPSVGDPLSDNPTIKLHGEERKEIVLTGYPALFEAPMYKANLKYLRDYSDPTYILRRHLLPATDPKNYTRAAVTGLQNLLALHRAGAEIGAGNDGGVPMISPALMSLEVRLMAEAGMSPAGALRSATLVNARILDREKELGTLAKGKLADIVILSGNPLEDIRNLERVEGVFIAGKLLYRTARMEIATGELCPLTHPMSSNK